MEVNEEVKKPGRARKGPTFNMESSSGDRRVEAMIRKLAKKEGGVKTEDLDGALKAIAHRKAKDGSHKYPEATKPEVRLAAVEALKVAGVHVAA